ncbi:hypothetical protein DFH06DRAFT_1331115 [Mycena polygramma]|nr:hypothetical protein DFH06DRAFT_1331115 [Mycena polygramma]
MFVHTLDRTFEFLAGFWYALGWDMEAFFGPFPKTVIGHRALMRRLDCFQKQLITFHAHILPLLEHPTLFAPDTLATIIQDAARASSLFRTICVALAAPSIHRNPILPLDIFSALPEASDASPRPLGDPDGIFMDDRIS